MEATNYASIGPALQLNRKGELTQKRIKAAKVCDGLYVTEPDKSGYTQFICELNGVMWVDCKAAESKIAYGIKMLPGYFEQIKAGLLDSENIPEFKREISRRINRPDSPVIMELKKPERKKPAPLAENERKVSVLIFKGYTDEITEKKVVITEVAPHVFTYAYKMKRYGERVKIIFEIDGVYFQGSDNGAHVLEREDFTEVCTKAYAHARENVADGAAKGMDYFVEVQKRINAATPTETPQISTETAETVKVSVEDERREYCREYRLKKDIPLFDGDPEITEQKWFTGFLYSDGKFRVKVAYIFARNGKLYEDTMYLTKEQFRGEYGQFLPSANLSVEGENAENEPQKHISEVLKEAERNYQCVKSETLRTVREADGKWHTYFMDEEIGIDLAYDQINHIPAARAAQAAEEVAEIRRYMNRLNGNHIADADYYLAEMREGIKQAEAARRKKNAEAEGENEAERAKYRVSRFGGYKIIVGDREQGKVIAVLMAVNGHNVIEINDESAHIATMGEKPLQMDKPIMQLSDAEVLGLIYGYIEPPQSPETPQAVECSTNTTKPRETARKRPNRAIGSTHAARRNTLRDTLRSVTHVPRECSTVDAAHW